MVGTVKVEWIKLSGNNCLKISINGLLNEPNAVKATSQWKEEIASSLLPGEKATIICNCQNMTGYEAEARKLYQKTIMDLSNQIGHLWIVTNDSIFKMAAKTMGVMTRFKIKSVNSEADIVFE